MKNHQPLRILLISPFFYPHIGGSQRYMEELYARLVHRQRNVTVDVLSYNTDKAPARETYRGLTIYRLPCWHILPGQFALPKLPWLIAAFIKLAGNHYDIVHTHIRFFDATWWAWAYARLIGAKSIFTEHVASHPVHQNPSVQLIAKIVDLTLAAWSLSHYDLITTTNKAARQFLKTTYHLTLPVAVVYGGVDTDFFSPKHVSRRRLPGVTKQFSRVDAVICYAGRLIWSKGITYLIQAIKAMLPKLPARVYFVIVGSGPLEEELDREVKNDNLTKRVFLTGPLSSRGVRDVLRVSDIFIHPSHHNEGFPNAVLEAAATGCFVIASDNAGVREVVGHKQTGYLVGQRDVGQIRTSLRWALNHRARRQKIATNMRELMVSRFDWKTIADKFYLNLNRLKQSNHRHLL